MERPSWRDVDGLIKLATVIAAWDVLRWQRGQQTFSNQFGALLTHKQWRYVAAGAWGILTHHLFVNLLPPRLRKTWHMPRRTT